MTVAIRPVLSLIAHPDVALILLLVGILLLYAEFNRPGTVLFGSLGMLFAMLALYGLALHPIVRASLIIAALGLALILLDLRFRARALLAVPGALILAYALNALIPAPPRIDGPTALATSILFTAVTLGLGRIALQARRNKRISPYPVVTRRRVD